MDAFLLSFGVVFVAELGDKSQLMALTLATRFRALPVLAGITVATTLVHAVSVLIGGAVGDAVPTVWVGLLAGLAFLGFAVWTLRGDTLSTADTARAAGGGRSAFLTTLLVFTVAELGDKTMLATVALATGEGLLGTWIGSTAGMVAADALAIAAGRWVGRALPERAIRIGAAVLFAAFGILLLVDAVRSA